MEKKKEGKKDEDEEEEEEDEEEEEEEEEEDTMKTERLVLLPLLLSFKDKAPSSILYMYPYYGHSFSLMEIIF